VIALYRSFLFHLFSAKKTVKNIGNATVIFGEGDISAFMRVPFFRPPVHAYAT
jgi:hypothetical protein